MKKIILLLLFFTFIHTGVKAQSTLIKAKGYLDVRTGKIIVPANILIEDGLIKSINPKKVFQKVLP